MTRSTNNDKSSRNIKELSAYSIKSSVNAVTTSDICTVGDSLRSKQNEEWMKAISEDLQAPEDIEVCKIVKTPKQFRPLTL